jgi:hypothetical protein
MLSWTTRRGRVQLQRAPLALACPIPLECRPHFCHHGILRQRPRTICRLHLRKYLLSCTTSNVQSTSRCVLQARRARRIWRNVVHLRSQVAGIRAGKRLKTQVVLLASLPQSILQIRYFQRSYIRSTLHALVNRRSELRSRVSYVGLTLRGPNRCTIHDPSMRLRRVSDHTADDEPSFHF